MADNKKESKRCINCIYATCMQWMQNPVIAHCRLTDERQVAEAKRSCKEFRQRESPAPIQHFASYDEG